MLLTVFQARSIGKLLHTSCHQWNNGTIEHLKDFLSVTFVDSTFLQYSTAASCVIIGLGWGLGLNKGKTEKKNKVRCASIRCTKTSGRKKTSGTQREAPKCLQMCGGVEKRDIIFFQIQPCISQREATWQSNPSLGFSFLFNFYKSPAKSFAWACQVLPSSAVPGVICGSFQLQRNKGTALGNYIGEISW